MDVHERGPLPLVLGLLQAGAMQSPLELVPLEAVQSPPDTTAPQHNQSLLNITMRIPNCLGFCLRHPG